ncbi:phosphotransferase family protein [Microlunatus endophyticus]|nr:phosphotransferase [Microlunatus endophyticus]
METRSFRIAGGNRTGCLRIGSNLRSFHKDAWAKTTFGKVLPVPQVWDYGELPNRLTYCLTSWAPGRTLQDLTADEINRTTPLVFDAWTRLQTDAIDTTSGFGDLDPDTLAGPYTSHHDRLRAELNDARKWPTTWTEPRSSAVSELLERYETLIEACPNDRAFIHGDWGTNNILGTADRLTAILDWEAAGIGDPLQDIAGRFWAFWPPVSTCVSALASYADQQLGTLPNYRERALCYDLQTGISEITECLQDDELDFAERCLDRCLDLLGDFDDSA